MSINSAGSALSAPRTRLGLIAGCAALLAINLSFALGVPTHYDARLDQADANIEKAIFLIMAAQNEGVDPPFNGFDEKAIEFLLGARRAVYAAKVYADSTSSG
jgi:hypothetical protein